MLSDRLFDGKQKLTDLTGRDLRFNEVVKGQILCSVLTTNTESNCQYYISKVKPERIAMADLKRLQIWDKLSKAKKEFILSGRDIYNSPAEKPQEKRGRKSKSYYSHIPRSFTCTCCNEDVSISPSVLVKRLGLDCKDTEEEREKISEFKSTFKCSTCSPRKRGRERNPLYKDIPRSIPCCGCGKECTVNSKFIYELTKGNISAIKVYVNEYLCTKCKRK